MSEIVAISVGENFSSFMVGEHTEFTQYSSPNINGPVLDAMLLLIDRARKYSVISEISRCIGANGKGKGSILVSGIDPASGQLRSLELSVLLSPVSGHSILTIGREQHHIEDDGSDLQEVLDRELPPNSNEFRTALSRCMSNRASQKSTHQNAR